MPTREVEELRRFNESLRHRTINPNSARSQRHRGRSFSPPSSASTANSNPPSSSTPPAGTTTTTMSTMDNNVATALKDIGLEDAEITILGNCAFTNLQRILQTSDATVSSTQYMDSGTLKPLSGVVIDIVNNFRRFVKNERVDKPGWKIDDWDMDEYNQWFNDGMLLRVKPTATVHLKKDEADLKSWQARRGTPSSDFTGLVMESEDEFFNWKRLFEDNCTLCKMWRVFDTDKFDPSTLVPGTCDSQLYDAQKTYAWVVLQLVFKNSPYAKTLLLQNRHEPRKVWTLFLDYMDTRNRLTASGPEQIGILLNDWKLPPKDQIRVSLVSWLHWVDKKMDDIASRSSFKVEDDQKVMFMISLLTNHEHLSKVLLEERDKNKGVDPPYATYLAALNLKATTEDKVSGIPQTDFTDSTSLTRTNDTPGNGRNWAQRT